MIANPYEDLMNVLLSVDSRISRIEIIMSKGNPSWQWINIKEAAKLLGLSKSSIYSKTSSDEIPYRKRGNKLYFNTKELHNWIKDNDK